MAYREMGMWEILEVLRWVHRGERQRPIARATGHSRSTIRRYVREAGLAGWLPARGVEPDEALASAVALRLRPVRKQDLPGESEALLRPHQAQIEAWLRAEGGARRGLLIDVNYSCRPHCLARIATGWGPLPHGVCYRPWRTHGGNNDPEDQRGCSSRVGAGDRGEVPRGLERREVPDPRRVCRGDGVPPQALDSDLERDRSFGGVGAASATAPLRRGCAGSARRPLGGLRSRLWQAAQAAPSGPRRGARAPRAPAARRPRSYQAALGERIDH